MCINKGFGTWDTGVLHADGTGNSASGATWKGFAGAVGAGAKCKSNLMRVQHGVGKCGGGESPIG